MTTSQPLPVLLVIDAQLGIDTPSWGQRNNPQAESVIERLLATWRERQWPVMHVRHDSTSPTSPLRPGEPGHAFKPEAVPREGEPVFGKTVNSSFIGTTLESTLQSTGTRTMVVVGFTTDHCVSTSVRMAANLGFDVILVSDGTATHERRLNNGAHFDAQTMHDTALASLGGEFAEIIAAEALLERL